VSASDSYLKRKYYSYITGEIVQTIETLQARGRVFIQRLHSAQQSVAELQMIGYEDALRERSKQCAESE
jgi:hypothetical protein